MDQRQEIYVDGSWVRSAATRSLGVIDATTEEVMGSIPAGTAEDVERAAAAARAALAAWAATPHLERCRLITRISHGLKARQAAIASLISHQVGTPYGISLQVQVGLALGVLANLEAAVEAVTWQEEMGSSLIVHEPIGVVGAITPWNYPLYQAVLKAAHAMAAGCTVVLKPSEVAPLDSYLLAEAIDEAGIPPGVFNLVLGTGPDVGEAMAAHPGIDAISFTGSTRAGVRVMQVAAESVKRVGLELGGKSATVILEGADLAEAVPSGVSSCFFNSGQSCTAPSRMIVPRSRLAEVEELAVATAEAKTLGDPFAPETTLGPLISAAQRDRVRAFIRQGIDEGAALLVGGPGAPEGLDKGFFIRPTVFSAVDSKMTIAQEEIFGPVLSIIPVGSEAEAIEVANDSRYGLSGSVWAEDGDRALAVALQIRTGQLDLNGGAFNGEAPFGGYKQSGNGREHGRYGIEDFLETKAIHR
jgi:acyl-CoA reductase-like NAD-dependent aldehyde dehydrogenase